MIKNKRNEALRRKAEGSRIPPGTETGSRMISTLSLSPIPEDHRTLEQLLSRQQWRIYPASTPVNALPLIRQHRIPLVVCEADTVPAAWKELLPQLAEFRNPPLLIVASRLADDHLWAEALNLGAYDVVAKPLEEDELTRILSQAWIHWNSREAGGLPMAKTMRAAS